jgi:hypothetical protein
VKLLELSGDKIDELKNENGGKNSGELPLKLLERNEVGSNGGYGGKLLPEGNEVGYSEVGGTYEDTVNDDGNISGNTYVGG